MPDDLAYDLAERTLMELCAEDHDDEVRLVAAQTLFAERLGLSLEEEARLKKLEDFLEHGDEKEPA